MAPRKPGRPKAADISDKEALTVILAFTDHKAAGPIDYYAGFPRKVVLAKLDKLQDRGWIDAKGKITAKGRAFLTEAA